MTDVPQLMAMAATTDSRHCLSKRSLKRQVADIKHITSDDQVSVRVDQNSATNAQSFEIYVYDITNMLHG